MKNFSTHLAQIIQEMENTFALAEKCIPHWHNIGFINQQYILQSLHQTESRLFALLEMPGLSVTPFTNRIQKLLHRIEDLTLQLSQ